MDQPFRATHTLEDAPVAAAHRAGQRPPPASAPDALRQPGGFRDSSSTSAATTRRGSRSIRHVRSWSAPRPRCSSVLPMKRSPSGASTRLRTCSRSATSSATWRSSCRSPWAGGPSVMRSVRGTPTPAADLLARPDQRGELDVRHQVRGQSDCPNGDRDRLRRATRRRPSRPPTALDRHYGWKLVLPVDVLGVYTAAARIHDRKHWPSVRHARHGRHRGRPGRHVPSQAPSRAGRPAVSGGGRSSSSSSTRRIISGVPSRGAQDP